MLDAEHVKVVLWCFFFGKNTTVEVVLNLVWKRRGSWMGKEKDMEKEKEKESNNERQKHKYKRKVK